MRYLLPILLLALCSCASPDPPSPEATQTGRAAWSEGTGTVVHLFEWRWDDVARECEEHLGPAGYTAVQVSPPSENHVIGRRPWFERYQPVSYALETRSGTRDQFAQMVSRCAAVGVDIYVDAVINHMTDADLEHESLVFSGLGTAGTGFTSFNYPGLYGYDDFHHCGLTETDDIADFDDREQVENCELVDLADLATEKPHVRTVLAGYLKDLASLGVAGIRIDAARHMATADITAILEEAGWNGYVYQEVTKSAHAARYVVNGAVTNFDFGYAVTDALRDGDLSTIVSAQWAIPAESALVFADNHDTQRHGVINYKDARYPLAVGLLLSLPNGRPRVMSSYAFENDFQGPPMDADEAILPADCAGPWVCEHRWPLVEGMVGFEAAVRGTSVMRVQEAGGERVAFSRGDRGWVAFNLSSEPWEVVQQTGLPGTAYCDVAAGPPNAEGCAGGAVRVDAGMVSATVPPGGMVAIHVGARAGTRTGGTSSG